MSEKPKRMCHAEKPVEDYDVVLASDSTAIDGQGVTLRKYATGKVEVSFEVVGGSDDFFFEPITDLTPIEAAPCTPHPLAVWIPEHKRYPEAVFLYEKDGNLEVWKVTNLEMRVCPSCGGLRPILFTFCEWSQRTALRHDADHAADNKLWPPDVVERVRSVATDGMYGAWVDDDAATCLVCGHIEEGTNSGSCFLDPNDPSFGEGGWHPSKKEER